MEPIRLDELSRDPVRVDLHPDTARALARTRLVGVEPAWEGGFALRPAGRVGAVQCGDLLVEVRPKAKVGLDRMLFLLGYAADPGFRAEDVAGVQEPDLFAALVESLLRQGERALLRGALCGYVHLDDALRTVRGRVRIGDQASRRPGMLLPLEVSYDEYTVDIPENRILRSALRRALTISRLPETARRLLLHLDAKLDGVAVLRPGAPLPRWHPSRLNAHYHPALRLAELVLRNMSAEAGPAEHTVTSFVVDMAKVFEDFVTTALRETLGRRSYHSQTQYPCSLDGPRTSGSEVRMRPDLVLMQDGEPSTVVDAKYKASSGSAYPNADQYQMLAYCTALRVQRAWLVYADAGDIRVRRVRNTGIDIVEYPIDLSQPPDRLLASIDALAHHATNTRKPTRTESPRSGAVPGRAQP